MTNVPPRAVRTAKPTTGWAGFINEQLDARGWEYIDLANATGIDRSLVGRWARGLAQPTIDSVRLVCDTLKRDIRQGLVAAGMFTPEELGLKTGRHHWVPDMRSVTDEELLAEVARRMGRHRIGHAVVVADAADLAEQPAVADAGELTEQNGHGLSSVPLSPFQTPPG